MRNVKAALSSLLSAVLINQSWATPHGWHVRCEYLDYSANIDPIVNPGAASNHVHDFVGSRPITPNTTNFVLRNSKCSACTMGGDKSAYWFPPLFQRLSNGKVVHLRPKFVTMYYLVTPKFAKVTKPFPDRLRMIAGDSRATSRNAKTNILFDYPLPNGTQRFTSYTFPKSTNGQKLKKFSMAVSFPNCIKANIYDGPASRELNDFTPYMKFVQQDQPCPTGYYRLPMLHFQPTWELSKPVAWSSPSEIPFRFSSGCWGNGYTFHADFMNGWDKQAFNGLMTSCANNQLGMSDGLNTPCQKMFVNMQPAEMCGDKAREAAKKMTAKWANMPKWAGVKAYSGSIAADQKQIVQDLSTCGGM